MFYIFVSSKTRDITSLSDLKKEDVKWCEPKGYELTSEYHYKTRHNTRIVDCYSLQPKIEEEIIENGQKLNIWHGYLLDEELLNEKTQMCPWKNYYGVYSHGQIGNENCWFATDEIGLSPLYYSIHDEILFISNNPHLIALYQHKLGYKIEEEETLAVWHTIGITNESDNTGYKGIYRVKPWRYIEVDAQDNIIFPSKEREGIAASYADLSYESIKQLRKGMSAINSRFTRRYSQLTGGMDSRLVLAFIMDGRYDQFQFLTRGQENNPDCIVASLLAKKYALNHTCTPHKVYTNDDDNIEQITREVCISNAMESSLVRMQKFMGVESNEVYLNGFGAIFAKSLDFSKSFQIFMNKEFNSQSINWEGLTPKQYAFAHNCFGYGNVDKFFLTEEGLEIANAFRKYIFDFNYNRFPENMNYADSMTAYRWRTHNSNLATMENNCIFLYSPMVLEASRKLSPELRQNAKLYFDMMWQLNPGICFVPYENRIYDPQIYKEYPEEIKAIFSKMEKITGSITSESQMSFFDSLLPILQKDLLDMLPTYVFRYVKREAIEMRLKEELTFGKPAFPLINLYGIAKWHEIIKDMNCK